MKKNSSHTHYDEIADIYIPHVERERSWNNLYERPCMLKLFDNFKDKNILDIGCGSGFYSEYAIQKGASVIAVDGSQKMLDYIKYKLNSEKLCTKQADLNFGLPFIESNSQDYIICSLVLHYLKDWNCIINDFYRILTSKGKIYISIQHPFADYLNLQKESYSDSYFVEDVWGTGNKPFIVRFYTRNLEEILKPILNSNFKLESFLEPLPDKRCKDLAPDTFKKIKKIPPFLFLVLSK